MKASLTIIFTAIATLATAQTPNPIKVNQVGYYPNSNKIATIESTAMAKTYTLRDAKTNKTVWKGKATAITSSPFSDKKRATVDFTSVTRPGNYILSAGKATQHVIIKEHALKDVAVASMKSFYLQRMSEPILKEYAGVYSRPAAHMDREVIVHPSAASKLRPAGTIISCPGGWYDAGDFNKYVVNSGFAMGMMLSAYELNPEYFNKLRLNIPESNNSLPDYLDEIAVNLRWMQTMQDPEDGGVYHKLTTPNFEGFIMPSECKQPRYVVEKTTAAALDFAACLAKASVIYRQFPECQKWADEMLLQSIKAYNWAKKNPSVFYRQNEMNNLYDPDITTGAYDDENVDDEFIWAATEIDKATIGMSADIYKEAYEHTFSLPTWGSLASLALYSKIGNASNGMIPESKALVQFADIRVEMIKNSAFASAFGNVVTDFGWGSNGEGCAGLGLALIYAYRLTCDTKYLDAAISVADHILGRNATGYCYVTGFGTFSPKHPHQRLSTADGIDEPLPGFLVGGPNPGQQDKDYCKSYTSSLPDESYTDDETSYASNEIAINWNASLAAFLNCLEAEMEKQ